MTTRTITDLILSEKPAAAPVTVSRMRLRLAQLIDCTATGEEAAGIETWRRIYGIKASVQTVVAAIEATPLTDAARKPAS